MDVAITLRVNGTERRLPVDTRTTLLDALRERLGITGPKKGCDHRQCSACTMLLDGRRLEQLAAWLAEDPTAGVRTLTRQLADAEGSRISESTVTALLRELKARQQDAAVVSSAGAFAQ